MSASPPARRRVPRRAALLIDAPEQEVRRAIRSVPTWTRAATASGLSLAIAGRAQPDGVLAPGDVLRVAGHRRTALFRVVDPRPSAGAESPARTVPDPGEVVRLAGLGRADGSTVTVSVAGTAAGTLVTVQVLGRVRDRRVHTLRRAQLLLGVIALAATAAPATPAGSADTASPAAPADSVAPADTADTAAPADTTGTAASVAPADSADTAAPGVVVAGVLVRDGAVLAARRTHPPELAGLWECPGGKVEPGESETDALARELAEELGIRVTVGDRIGPECAVGGGLVLRAYRAELTDGEPSPTVHDAVRWVTADQIDALPWLPSDAPLIAELRRLLGPTEAVPAASSPP